MQQIIEIIQNLGPLFGAADKVLAALIVFFLLIPGEQPEKFLQGVLDFLRKLSFKGFQ